MKLLELRKKENLTQDRFAEKIRIKKTTYKLYEYGRRKLPVEVAKKIGEKFKINWWELYED